MLFILKNNLKVLVIILLIFGCKMVVLSPSTYDIIQEDINLSDMLKNLEGFWFSYAN